MEQIYYKKFLGDRIQIHGVDCEDMKLIYNLNEWTYPKNKKTGLFVFDTLENARRYNYGSEIYSCKVINPRMISCMLDVGVLDDDDSGILESFWEGAACRDITESPPKGTIICDAVMLLEQVYPEIV